jgi:hypothetical protein
VFLFLFFLNSPHPPCGNACITKHAFDDVLKVCGVMENKKNNQYKQYKLCIYVWEFWHHVLNSLSITVLIYYFLQDLLRYTLHTFFPLFC